MGAVTRFDLLARQIGEVAREIGCFEEYWTLRTTVIRATAQPPSVHIFFSAIKSPPNMATASANTQYDKIQFTGLIGLASSNVT
jgi:hypothetical protein